MAGTVPLGILSLQFWNDAKAYLLAAETLIQNSQTEQPTYFLLSHALELTFKAYLAAHGVGVQALKDLGHDINQAYQKAAGLGLSVDGQHTPALIRALSEFHNAFVFRYPIINKDGDLVIIRTVVKADEVLQAVTAIWRRVESHAIRARLRAVKGGKYPVEEWHMGGSKK